MKILFCILAALFAASAAPPEFHFSFDASQNRWTLANSVMTAVFEVTADGIFQLDEAGLNASTWKASTTIASSPIRFVLNGVTFDGTTQWVLIDQHTEKTTRNGNRQVIVLQDAGGTVQVQVNLDLFAGQPVLRSRLAIKNLTGNSGFISLADMLPYSLDNNGGVYRAFSVAQWAVQPRDLDFETSQVTLNPNATPLLLHAGAAGSQVGWVAVRDATNHGVFAGWEFNGRSNAWVRNSQANRQLQFSAPVDSIHHPIAPGQTFYLPAAFLGFYTGDWDEAGYRTQRFVEASLARPAPDLQRFPYMSWDSWAYQEQFDENALRQSALIASQLGVELFIVDLGWAKQIGDWNADPAKFPSGLKALSDYVHSLGMKFGLHLTPAEAGDGSPVLQANPDWTATESDNYFGALSLCLSHVPVRTWLVQEIVRVIDSYGVDWILQDGQNMVKSCTKTTHTHDPADSNYSNAEEGIDWVVQQVLAQRPNVSWENCENGGNMMTFKMVQNYVTSITNDASGALGSRQGVFGATYPLSPRFADRYSPENPVNAYNTLSYMFGGPWHLMNRLDQMTSDQLSFAAWEIAAYKSMRGGIRDGKVYHLTAAPGNGRIDAIESSLSATKIVAIVTREGGDADTFTLKLRGVSAASVYRVHFQSDPRTLTMTGTQLSQTGVQVNLPDPQSAEIVFADRN